MTAPTKLILKKSSVANKIPQASDLDHGELAINFADGIIYYKNSSNQVKNFRDLSVLDSDIATSGSIIFEGSVADAHETTLTVVNPTADRVLQLPDADGRLATSDSIQGDAIVMAIALG
tara:strand:- start:327 stop:683 length:357 start_codon:yes stop_codon:yes gene_type:complete